MRTMVLVSLIALALSACGTLRAHAAGEPGGSAAPSAADQAIWLDPDDPSRGMIVTADSRAGLSVSDLAGRQLQALPGGRPTSVDLRDGFRTPAGERVLVAVADDGGAGAALYLLDPERRTLAFWAAVPLDLAQPYDLCLARRGAAFLVIVSGAEGQIRQLAVEAGADGGPRLKEERRFAIDGRPAGCAADDSGGRLYLTESGHGVWRFDLAADAAEGEMIADAPFPALLPDVKGLSLLKDGEATWLVASSQADSAFVVWKVEEALSYHYGTFSVGDAGGAGGVTGTNGLAARGRLLGGFPEGLVVMQDVDQGPAGMGQSLKLVRWSAVREALGL